MVSIDQVSPWLLQERIRHFGNQAQEKSMIYSDYKYDHEYWSGVLNAAFLYSHQKIPTTNPGPAVYGCRAWVGFRIERLF